MNVLNKQRQHGVVQEVIRMEKNVRKLKLISLNNTEAGV